MRKSAECPEIRVMTYNVRYFGHPTRGLTSTASAMRGIARAVATLDQLPDVIALQEVESTSLRADFGRPRATPQLDRLLRDLHAQLDQHGQSVRYVARYFPSHRYKLPGVPALYSTGLAVLVSDAFTIEVADSQPPMDVTHRRLRATAKLKQTRICAHLSLRHTASGACVDVFNTHLSLPQFFSWNSLAFTQNMGSGQNQLLELFSVLDYVEQARTSDAYLLMGDFNAQPGSLVYQQVIDSGLLTDPLSDAHAFEMDQYRRFPSAGFMHLRMRLDYLFASPGLRWLDFDDTHAFGAPGHFHGLSDHTPVVGRVQLAA